ncbi:MAG: F0F1 ATP synthase subunit epsilon [Magnetospirillum sp.]|nr:F0F1 ATP synthase subunit epsilon [Magnetospirillum sp.]
MAYTVHVDLVSAEEKIHSGPAEMVFAPTLSGEVGILPHHAPMLTLMRAGDVRIVQPAGTVVSFFVSGGILDVQPDGVTLLSDTVLRAEDIDAAEAEEARQLAERAMKGERETLAYSEAYAQLTEALAKLRVVRLMRIKQGDG